MPRSGRSCCDCDSELNDSLLVNLNVAFDQCATCGVTRAEANREAISADTIISDANIKGNSISAMHILRATEAGGIPANYKAVELTVLNRDARTAIAKGKRAN